MNENGSDFPINTIETFHEKVGKKNIDAVGNSISNSKIFLIEEALEEGSSDVEVSNLVNNYLSSIGLLKNGVIVDIVTTKDLNSLKDLRQLVLGINKEHEIIGYIDFIGKNAMSNYNPDNIRGGSVSDLTLEEQGDLNSILDIHNNR